MKTEVYKFDPVIYPFPLLVTKRFDLEELKRKFYAVISETDVTEITNELTPNPTTVARTMLAVDRKSNNMFILCVIYLPQSANIGVVAHEAFHINTFNADWLGFGAPTPGTDEPHAYFAQWAANCIDSVLKGHPEKMKGELKPE